MTAFKIRDASFLYFESLNADPSKLFPSDLSRASKCQGTLTFKSSILLIAHLFHTCMRVPKWDADPECQPNY
jgi:hypothetical protein